MRDKCKLTMTDQNGNIIHEGYFYEKSNREYVVELVASEEDIISNVDIIKLNGEDLISRNDTELG